MIRYKAWRKDPSELWADFMPDKYAQKDRIALELEAYHKAYHAWLDTPTAALCIHQQKLKRDLEQAILAHRIWRKSDDDLYEPDVALQQDPSLKQTDWMQMSCLADMMDFTANIDACTREQPWDEFLQPLQDIDRERAKTHAKDLIQADEYRAILPQISRDTLNHEQKLGYDIICKHYTQKVKKPLYMIIHGTAGTGKTHLLQATINILLSTLFLTALTGKAASIFFGVTTHSLINLPIRRKIDL